MEVFGEEQTTSEAEAKCEGLGCLSKGFEILLRDASKGLIHAITGSDLGVRQITHAARWTQEAGTLGTLSWPRHMKLRFLHGERTGVGEVMVP